MKKKSGSQNHLITFQNHTHSSRQPAPQPQLSTIRRRWLPARLQPHVRYPRLPKRRFLSKSILLPLQRTLLRPKPIPNCQPVQTTIARRTLELQIRKISQLTQNKKRNFTKQRPPAVPFTATSKSTQKRRRHQASSTRSIPTPHQCSISGTSR